MKTLSYIKIFVLLIASYFVLCVLSSMIPNERIKYFVTKSAIELDKEGCYPKAILNLSQCQMDNFTDALILDQMSSIDSKKPIASAMAAKRRNLNIEMAHALLVSLQDNTEPTAQYARYWHGTTFVFRPFFLSMDYSTLRFFLFAISSVLLFLFAIKYSRKTNIWKTLLLITSFLSCYVFVMQFSLQFFPVLAITLGGATLLCNDNNRINSNIGLFFFITGSITSFFDLLTTPLLTLGFPLLVWISLQPDEQREIKKDVVTIFKHSVSWFSGFALTWVTKWLLGTIVLGENIFSDAWGQSVYRLEVEDFTRWDAICQNFGMLNFPLIIIALSLILIAIIVSFNKKGWKKAVLFVIVGLSPYCWYFVLSNHSYLHWWFTYRNQITSVACCLLALASFVSTPMRKPMQNQQH